MFNKRILKQIENKSRTTNISNFITKLIMYEETSKGNWRWREKYHKEIRYFGKEGDEESDSGK